MSENNYKCPKCGAAKAAKTARIRWIKDDLSYVFENDSGDVLVSFGSPQDIAQHHLECWLGLGEEMTEREKAETANIDFSRQLSASNERVRVLEEEKRRLCNRDCNASIELCYDSGDNPFAREELKIVDVGVADNCYVVESQLVSELQSENARLRGIVEKLHVALNNALSFLDRKLLVSTFHEGLKALAASKAIWPDAPLTGIFADEVFSILDSTREAARVSEGTNEQEGSGE